MCDFLYAVAVSFVLEGTVDYEEVKSHWRGSLERVEQGTEIIITRRGKPIARVLPIEDRPRLSDAQQSARERLRQRMERGYALGGARVDRETLHERGL